MLSWPYLTDVSLHPISTNPKQEKRAAIVAVNQKLQENNALHGNILPMSVEDLEHMDIFPPRSLGNRTDPMDFYDNIFMPWLQQRVLLEKLAEIRNTQGHPTTRHPNRSSPLS
jgi:hypothetical protein